MPIATTTATTPATSPTNSTAAASTRYQSSVAPHFPMKTMLTPRNSTSASSSSSSSKVTSLTKTHDHAYSYGGGLLDANGSMAAAFAMSTVPGSSSNAATVVCKVPKFLRSLYAILQTEDPAVISWVENRELKPNRVTAFHILAMDRFEREVLPKYFKHQKFASFQRQLNNFGFRKWTKTQSSGVCTFSHNSFPPDPTASGGVLRASFREQWRQKSPLTVSSPSLAVHASHQQPPRRRVGNGITKADRKSSSRRNAAAVSAVRVEVPPPTESFMDLYKSPLNAAGMMSDGRAQQPTYMPSHQPATKKLARPLHELSGLEAFCDDTYKQFILPPLQPHHLLATTPRSMYAALGETGEPTTPSLGGFPHARSLSAADYSNLKPYEYPEKATSSGHHHAHSQSMDASFTGAFLEPWSWDAANMNSALELSAFPLDFDWQDAQQQQQHMAAQQQQQQQQQQQLAQVSVSVGVAPLHQPHLHASKDAFCHPHDSRVATSAEEFGLETFLFAE